MVGGSPGVEEGPGAPTSLFFCRLSSLLFFLISAKTSSRFLLDSSASIAFLKPFFLVSVLVPGLSDILRLFPWFDACAEGLPSLGFHLPFLTRTTCTRRGARCKHVDARRPHVSRPLGSTVLGPPPRPPAPPPLANIRHASGREGRTRPLRIFGRGGWPKGGEAKETVSGKGGGCSDGRASDGRHGAERNEDGRR